MCMLRANHGGADAAGLALGSALVDVIHGLEKDLETMKDQSEAEQTRSKKSKQKLDTLQGNAAELESRLELARDAMDQLFDGIIIHRYRYRAHSVSCPHPYAHASLRCSKTPLFPLHTHSRLTPPPLQAMQPPLALN